MITEDYVSFETAKLLKEKRFDWYTYDYYEDEDNPNINLRASKAINWNKTEFISKPTLQVAIKWLREMHKIGVFPSTYSHVKSKETTHDYGVAIVSLVDHNLLTDKYFYSSTYEKACESAIRYCLENLI